MGTPNLEVNIGHIRCKNPVLPASGTFGVESAQFIDVSRLGAIVPKSVTLEPREGNPPPRIAEVVAGLINSVGIQNKGALHFVNELVPFFQQFDTPIIASASAYSIDEFKRIAEIFNQCPHIDGIELNISCPNLKEEGRSFGMSCEASYQVVKTVKENSDKVIIPKLSPNVTDIAEIALVCQEAKADALTVANTLTSMAIDIETRKPKLANIVGGLCGPAIKPVVVRMVWQVAKVVDIPVIGVGGISNYKDAIEYFIAGATAVQVGVANLVNPHVMIDIIEGIEKFMIEKSIDNMDDLIKSIVME